MGFWLSPAVSTRDSIISWLADVTFDWRPVVETAIEGNNQTCLLINFLRRLLYNIYNTEFNDLRKIICLRKIVSLAFQKALVCRMQISGAWHAITEMEWVHSSVYHSNLDHKIYTKHSPSMKLSGHQSHLQLLWQHSCDAIQFLQCIPCSWDFHHTHA